jgi:glutamate racemase
MRYTKGKCCFFVCLFLVAAFCSSCSSSVEKQDTRLTSGSEKFSLISEISSDQESPFYIDFSEYPHERDSLPIGVFDSGTGGLTVLNALIRLDAFDNRTHERGSDGIPDFVSEKFIYLGDKANMPYGRYPSEGKTDFLKELIIKDVQFLLADKYSISPEEKSPAGEKLPVKAIVIACNTATAYGFELVERILEEWGLDMKAVGIIDAGAREAVELYNADTKDAVAVFATEGTCSSMGYPRALERYFSEKGIKGVAILQQPCFGLAGAVDGDPAYIAPDTASIRGSVLYQGPGIGHPVYSIDLSLWEEYHFDTGDGLLLERDEEGNIITVELNSVENYIKYCVTSLVTEALERGETGRIRSVILGCTHYPLFEQEFRNHFLFLRSVNEKYRDIIPEKIRIIDPAEAEAVSLYLYFRENNLFGRNKNNESRFFLSVPNPLLDSIRIDSAGEFPVDYKYGRDINSSFLYVKRVPLQKKHLPEALLLKLQSNLPDIYALLFNTN